MAARLTQWIQASPAEVAVMADLRKRGYEAATIARLTGWSVRTVNRCLRRAGLVRAWGKTRAAILLLHRRGKTVPEIAEALDRAPHTVYWHLGRLGLTPHPPPWWPRTEAQLAAAVRRGLEEGEDAHEEGAGALPQLQEVSQSGSAGAVSGVRRRAERAAAVCVPEQTRGRSARRQGLGHDGGAG